MKPVMPKQPPTLALHWFKGNPDHAGVGMDVEQFWNAKPQQDPDDVYIQNPTRVDEEGETHILTGFGEVPLKEWGRGQTPKEADE